MSDYKVGQILFIIPEGAANVVPVMITERRIIETVEGTIVKHVVKGPKPKGKQWYLETVPGQVFSDIKVVRELMVSNATAAIDSMLKHAYNVAQQAFEQKHVVKPVQQIAQQDVEHDIFNGSAEELVDEDDHVKNYDAQETKAVDQNEGYIDVLTSNGQLQKVKLKVG